MTAGASRGFLGWRIVANLAVETIGLGVVMIAGATTARRGDPTPHVVLLGMTVAGAVEGAAGGDCSCAYDRVP